MEKKEQEGQRWSWKKSVITVLLLAAFAGILYSVNQFDKVSLTSTTGQAYKKAVVVKVVKDNLAEDGDRYGSQQVIVRMLDGTDKGREFDATSPSGTLFGAACKVGMHVIVIDSNTNGNHVVTVYSQNRQAAIYIFLAIFTAIVCLIGGKKGVKAVVGLAFTFLCIRYLMFPLIYQGISPIFVAIVVAVLATVVTLLLLNGWCSKTSAAILGTSCGVAIAGVGALLFGHFAGISGYNVSDIDTLNFIAEYSPIKIGGLLFAGIIISSLGAVMDVGISIASTIQEVHAIDPAVSRKQLFLSGIRVGRDMMGTMVNTLILAFVGGSITTLITNYAYSLSYNQLMNSYNIGIEIMQGLSGSLGIVLTVPISAAFAAFFLTGKRSVETDFHFLNNKTGQKKRRLTKKQRKDIEEAFF